LAPPSKHADNGFAESLQAQQSSRNAPGKHESALGKQDNFPASKVHFLQAQNMLVPPPSNVLTMSALRMPCARKQQQSHPKRA
jgi:hypothetical protein